MRQLIVKAGMALLLMFIVHTLAVAQVDYGKVFGTVPEPRRTRLVERLQQLIEYQRAERWDRVYNLISRAATTKTKQEFISWLKETHAEDSDSQLIKFIPYSALPSPTHNDSWDIYGCGYEREKGRTVALRYVVAAYWEMNDWYFSLLTPDVALEATPKPCHGKVSSRQNKLRISRSNKHH